ncbi:hypothetical protein QEN19_000919 [Hanseniaspora menglaensis]
MTGQELTKPESELHDFLTSYFHLNNLTKVNYNQYIGANGNEQWCFQSDLYLRSRDNKTLVSLFSKELWCFSLNDDPVPLPYEKEDSFINMSFVDSEVIDFSIIQERIPDKIGHFTPNFAKPNLPTPYAIFLKAVRRLIYLNLCSLSLNKYIPFGNSCLVNDKLFKEELKILNFSPHLFEDGSLSVSINYKNLSLISFKTVLNSSKSENIKLDTALDRDFLDSCAVYIAPSSVKCTIQFSNDTIDSCISKKAPKNSNKILKILKISHGLDLIDRKDEIKWIKVVPSILHLSGQTPPIFDYLQDENKGKNTSSNTVLWPLDLIYLQKGEKKFYPFESKVNLKQSIDDTFQMIQEISELNSKLNLNFTLGNEEKVFISQDHCVEEMTEDLNNNMPLLQNPASIQHSSPFLMSMTHGSPERLNPTAKSMFSLASLQNNNHSVQSSSNQVASPFFRLKSLESSPAFGLIEKELFKNNDTNKSLDSEAEMNTSSVHDEIKEDEEENGSIDVDDEMRDLFGEDDDEEEEGDDNENVVDKSPKSSFKKQELSSDQVISSSITETKPFGFKRPFSIIENDLEGPRSSGYSYADPGAPIPATLTPAPAFNIQSVGSTMGTNTFSRDRRSSVYSHINFNPIIDSVDSKYKQGGKFAFSLLQNNVNDQLFNDEHNANSSRHNHEENECTPDDINLQEIMLQASQKIKQTRTDEISDDEISSDEDDNGMISIRDITSTNIAIPITSITHHNNNNLNKSNHNAVNQLGSNNLEGYQSLPYSSIFTSNNHPNYSAKNNGAFPLSVINEISNNSSHVKDLKNIVYPLSVPPTGVLNEPNHQNNLLSGNEYYKHQLQTKSTSPGLSLTSHSNSGAALNQRDHNGTEMLDNLMVKLPSPTAMKQLHSFASPAEDDKHFIDEIILSSKSKKLVTSDENQKQQRIVASTINEDIVLEEAEEDKNVNVLPFVLRHMPVFSIPFHFYNDHETKITGLNKDVFLKAFERELVFNPFLFSLTDERDSSYGKENIFYEPVQEIENIFQRLFPKFDRLKLGKDLLASDKFVSEFARENNYSESKKSIIVRDHNGKDVLIDSKALKNWAEYNFQPVSSKNSSDFNDTVYSCLITSSHDDDSKLFMKNLKHIYSSKRFGKIKLICDDESGILTVPDYKDDYLNIIALKIVKNFVAIKTKKNVLILLPISSTLKERKNDVLFKLKFFSKLKVFVKEILPLLSLNVQLVPETNVSFMQLNELHLIILSIFNKIRISHEIPETYFGKLLPTENDKFKDEILHHNYSVPIVTNTNVPYFNVPKNNKFDNYIIVSYSRSVDKKYLTASWVLPNATNFSFKTWKLNDSTKFEKVCDEIWSKTMKLILKFSENQLIGDSNCVILTRLNSVLPDDELMHWRRLSSKNKNVSLAVVCVGWNRENNKEKDAILSDLPSTPKKNIHFTIFKNSLPLSNSQHRCSIKTGAVISVPSNKNANFNIACHNYLEINLLNCPHSSSAMLLDTIMLQYYELSLLNSCFGIKCDTVVPFNLLIIEKVLNKVIHLDI